MEGQLVLLLDHMPGDVTEGYELYFSILLKVNGQAIHSMEDLLMSIVNCKEKQICFSLLSRHLDSFYHDVVLNMQEAKDATPDILRRYAIPHALSNDL